MDIMSAFAMGRAHMDQRMRVFDWHKAAELIREHKPSVAVAGLGDDWGETAGRIYQDGAPVPEERTCVYLASTWATPEIRLDNRVEECWCWKDETEWNAKTYWPESALAILNQEVS